jgi:hypothetical protein
LLGWPTIPFNPWGMIFLFFYFLKNNCSSNNGNKYSS